MCFIDPAFIFNITLEGGHTEEPPQVVSRLLGSTVKHRDYHLPLQENVFSTMSKTIGKEFKITHNAPELTFKIFITLRQWSLTLWLTTVVGGGN